jgi:hypothetical protein
VISGLDIVRDILNDGLYKSLPDVFTNADLRPKQ